MGKTDGIAVLKEAKKINPETMVIIFTGSAVDPLQLGAEDYILKPCESDQLRKRVARCLERLEGKRSGGRLGLVGQEDCSPARNTNHSIE